MKRVTAHWPFGLVVLTLCGLITFFAFKHHSQLAQEQAKRAEAYAVVHEAEKNDNTPQAEKARLQQIGDKVAEKKSVRDDDFKFLLTEANKPCPQGSATISHLAAILTLESMKQPLPSSQKAILYQELTPVLAQPDLTAISGITMAQMRELETCDLLAHFDVREAVPQIVPLLDDPKPQIRNNAKRALRKLGYNV